MSKLPGTTARCTSGPTQETPHGNPLALGTAVSLLGAEAAAPAAQARARNLWRTFLAANEWETGHRKDWEFCTRTWRDGECFLRLFRQPAWPPRVHFIDPEHIRPDPRTGRPAGGIETEP